jgi:lactate dehydrogenase-like 2-hydroxyacid dehydrogenase
MTKLSTSPALVTVHTFLISVHPCCTAMQHDDHPPRARMLSDVSAYLDKLALAPMPSAAPAHGTIGTEDVDPDPASDGNTVAASKKKVAVFGMGDFGTAMAMAVARNGHEVVAVVRDPLQADHINTHHRNPRYLTAFDLPRNITATTDLASAVQGCVLMISALPCQLAPQWLAKNKDLLPADV